MEHAVRIGFPFAWGFAFGLPVCSLAFQLVLCSGRSVLLRSCGSVPTLFLHFSSYFTLTLALPLCDCNAASTLCLDFSSYSVSTFQVLLDFCVSGLTLRRHFSALFVSAFRFLLNYKVSGLTLLPHWGAYSALGHLGWDLERGRFFASTLDSLPSFCAYYTMCFRTCQGFFIKNAIISFAGRRHLIPQRRAGESGRRGWRH